MQSHHGQQLLASTITIMIAVGKYENINLTKISNPTRVLATTHEVRPLITSSAVPLEEHWILLPLPLMIDSGYILRDTS